MEDLAKMTEKTKAAPLWCALGLALFCYCGLYTLAAHGAQEPAPEEQLAHVNAAIGKIESWLNAASNNRSSLEKELRATTRRVDTLNTQVQANQRSIDSLESDIAALTQRAQSLEKERLAQLTLIKSALRASYASGQEPYLKLLLNQDDAEVSSRMLHYYSAFNRARMSQIEQFRELLAQLDNTQREAAEAAQTLARQQDALQQQVVALNADKAQRAALLLSLNEDIASRSGELEQLTADRKHLEALLAQIQAAIAAIPPPEQLTPFAQAKGSLPWPVDGKPLNRFGASYSDGNLHRQGVVLSAAGGSPVRAIHPGRVVFADWLRGSGLLVVVDHGDGYLSLYANNRSLVKQKGDWVNRAEALATAGDNAGMNQAGIYFEIRHNGQAQDPAQWCRS